MSGHMQSPVHAYNAYAYSVVHEGNALPIITCNATIAYKLYVQAPDVSALDTGLC